MATCVVKGCEKRAVDGYEKRALIGNPEEPGETHSQGIVCWCQDHTALHENSRSLDRWFTRAELDAMA